MKLKGIPPNQSKRSNHKYSYPKNCQSDSHFVSYPGVGNLYLVKEQQVFSHFLVVRLRYCCCFIFGVSIDRYPCRAERKGGAQEVEFDYPVPHLLSEVPRSFLPGSETMEYKCVPHVFASDIFSGLPKGVRQNLSPVSLRESQNLQNGLIPYKFVRSRVIYNTTGPIRDSEIS